MKITSYYLTGAKHGSDARKLLSVINKIEVEESCSTIENCYIIKKTTKTRTITYLKIGNKKYAVFYSSNVNGILWTCYSSLTVDKDNIDVNGVLNRIEKRIHQLDSTGALNYVLDTQVFRLSQTPSIYYLYKYSTCSGTVIEFSSPMNYKIRPKMRTEDKSGYYEQIEHDCLVEVRKIICRHTKKEVIEFNNAERNTVIACAILSDNTIRYLADDINVEDIVSLCRKMEK